MDRVSRMVLASLLLLVVFAGTVVLTNLGWMPAIYPTMVTYPEASTRVAVAQADVTVPPSEGGSALGSRWVSQLLPLRKGESVTIELKATTVPTITLWTEGITLTIGRTVVISGPMVSGPWGNQSLAYSSTFCNALYNGSRLFAPKECIVPETANDYQVIVTNYYRYDMKVSFKLTVRSTLVVGGPDSASPPIAPYGKAQTLMMLWLLLGVGILVGAAFVLLVRPRLIVQPVPSPTLPPSLRTSNS